MTIFSLKQELEAEDSHAKVNPPIRPREDVEALWQAVLDRKIDWIVSDHACCSAEQKWSKDDPTNIWLAKSGFGGTEYLLSGVMPVGKTQQGLKMLVDNQDRLALLFKALEALPDFRPDLRRQTFRRLV